MKIFSEPKHRPPLSRSKAWTYLLINALVCPGMGSVMARRFSGLPQLVLAWGGAIWMVMAMAQYILAWLRTPQIDPDWRSYLSPALGGLAFFLAGWVWSIFTGVCFLREAQKREATLAVHTIGP